VKWVPNKDTGVQEPQALSCLSETDFSSRYGKTAFTFVGNCDEAADLPGVCSVRYLPTGLGTNVSPIQVLFTSGSKEVKVEIQPGGVASVKKS